MKTLDKVALWVIVGLTIIGWFLFNLTSPESPFPWNQFPVYVMSVISLIIIYVTYKFTKIL